MRSKNSGLIPLKDNLKFMCPFCEREMKYGPLTTKGQLVFAHCYWCKREFAIEIFEDKASPQFNPSAR